MGDGSRIKITSRSSSLLETNVTINLSRYLVLTEVLSERAGGGNIITRVYLGGELIDTRTSRHQRESGRKCHEQMQEQHECAVGLLKKAKMAGGGQKEAENYLKEAMAFLKNKQYRMALDVLSEGSGRYPEDALLLSYYGCLKARLGDGIKDGISGCLKAIKHTERLPFGAEFFFPVLYLNLGRAYLAAREKKEAVGAFEKGLAADPENRELRQEMKKLGDRKNPVLPLLGRSNPVNRYAGKLRHALQKRSKDNR